MNPFDPDREAKRLQESYSTMTDIQLLDLAGNSDEITDFARIALHKEIERRGLKVGLEDSPPPNSESDGSELTAVRLFRDLPEALLAKGLLESACIECFLADDNMSSGVAK
jgi:hypothetical protein